MKKISLMLIVLAATAYSTTLILAEGPTVKPGKWQYTATIHTPMMSEPRVTTDTHCITEEEAEQDPLAMLVEEGDCKVLNRKVNGDTIEFELECEGDMGVKTRGKGTFTAHGTTASGNMEMTMEVPQMGGKAMKMTQEWEGKWIGDCEKTNE